VKVTKRRDRVRLNHVDVRAVVDQLGLRIKDDRGDNLRAWCVFHEDGDNPNLNISTVSGGAFHCFSCGTNGNLLHLVEKMVGVDRKGAWEYLSGMNTLSATAESIKRRLDKRAMGRRDVDVKIDSIMDGLYSLLKLSPGYCKSIQIAQDEYDAERLFFLMDYDYEVLRLMVDDLFSRSDDFKACIRGGEITLDEFLFEAQQIQRFADRSGYLNRFPCRFDIDSIWMFLGKVRWGCEKRVYIV